MKTYLWKPSELQLVAHQDLGVMNMTTYAEAMQKASAIPAINPLLVIDLVFKPNAHPFLTETCYPISEDEWDDFVRDARTMCEYMPHVWVVDGDLYTAPI